MLSINDLMFCAYISVFSVVWCWILTDRGMLFDWLYELVKQHLEERCEWLWNVIYGCPKCFSGQVALWLYLYMHWNDYNFIKHIFAISTTIFFTWFLMNYYIKQYANKKN